MAIEGTTASSDAKIRASGGNLFDLVVAGAVLETVLLVGFMQPLSIWKHRDVVPGDQPLAVVLGGGRAGAIYFLVVTFCAFAAFAVAVWLARRVTGGRALRVVLGGTVLFAAALIPINPVGAQDVYHNVADARTLWLHGDNPMSTPPAAHPEDPFFAHVPVWADHAASYGPLWYVIAGAPLPFAGSDLWANVIGQKLIAVAFLLVVTTLASRVAERLRPGAGIAAGVLIGWNPLLLFETAGNAHNDVVMAAFALAAFYAIVRKWWLAVFPLLALAVAVKYTLLILGPPILIWMVVSGRVPMRAVASSLFAGIAVGLLIFSPVLRDGSLFDALSRQGDYFDSSPGSVFIAYLLEHRTISVQDAAHQMKIAFGAAFALGYVVLIARVVRQCSVEVLADTSSYVILLFLFTASWWFWPWYLVWLVPFAALRPHRAGAFTAAVFSLTAMLMYVPHFWQLYSEWGHLQRIVVATTFTAPLALVLLQLVRWSVGPGVRRLSRLRLGRAAAT